MIDVPREYFVIIYDERQNRHVGCVYSACELGVLQGLVIIASYSVHILIGRRNRAERKIIVDLLHMTGVFVNHDRVPVVILVPGKPTAFDAKPCIKRSQLIWHAIYPVRLWRVEKIQIFRGEGRIDSHDVESGAPM